MDVIKIYDSERPKEGWVKVDGGLNYARDKARALLRDYDNLDCDNGWNSFIAIAVNDEVIEALVGDYDSWLFNPTRRSVWIYDVPAKDFEGEDISIPLHPRKDYIL